jgi:hypothetical protein
MVAASKQVVSFQMFYSGSWHDITSDVFVQEEISVLWGQGSEGAALRPGSIKLTLNNSAGTYDPSNAMSPLYGLAGRNTPVALLIDGVIQMEAEATSWSPGQTLDFRVSPARGRATVDLETNGVLQRISQSSTLLGSALTRFDRFNFTSMTAHYPLEDDRNTTVPLNLVPGVTAAFTGIEFGEGGNPPGSDPVVKLNSGQTQFLRCRFLPTVSTTTGWSMSWIMRLDSVDPVSPAVFGAIDILVTASGGLFTAVEVDSNGVTMASGDGVNTPVISTSNPFSTTDWTQWQLCTLTATLSAGVTTIEWDFNTIGSGSIGFLSGTYTGDPGRLVDVRFYQNVIYAGRSNACVGHVIGVDGVSQNLISSQRLDAFAGHPGETVGARFGRIAGTEEGFNVSIKGSASTTVPMGPQENQTLIDFLESCEATEDGMVYDNKTGIGIILRTRNDRYNQTPLALTYPGHISEPFDKIIDDLGTHNKVTINNVTGSQATKELTTGPMSTQTPPSGVGLTPQTIDVNVTNEGVELPLLAGWWLNRGTLPNPRWSAVNIDLVANPGLKAAVNALVIGDLVTITGAVADPISLIVLGIAQKIGSHSRMVTLTTVPADLFVTAVYDGTLRRYDSASTTVVASKTTTAVSWAITTANFGDVWSVTPGYQWAVAGELMTVSAMTAAAGTGPWTQTATVVRSVNGVVKIHAAGESIRVANPGRFAL